MTRTLGPFDHFFELGGTSMQAVSSFTLHPSVHRKSPPDPTYFTPIPWVTRLYAPKLKVCGSLLAGPSAPNQPVCQSPGPAFPIHKA